MLHLAASRGHFEMVKYFLNNREYYRKNVNIQNDLGETPLHSATSSFIMGNPYLKLRWAIQQYKLSQAYLSSKLYTIYETDNNGNVDVIEFLLDFGANLNARTKWGDTPGHYAACFASFEALKFLIEEGVDMEKETPGKFSNRYIY